MIIENFGIGSNNGLPEQVEFYRADANRRLNLETRSALGQFMTPAPVAAFMASLFSKPIPKTIRVLDPGAGVGSLTAAFVERMCQHDDHPEAIFATVYEIDSLLINYLKSTLKDCQRKCKGKGIKFDYEIAQEDFICSATGMLKDDLFFESRQRLNFTHTILNPPYKKIRSDSKYRLQLSSVGIETSNLYTAFVALATKMLAKDGELIAIVPRSFCNGPYFKPFRKLFLKSMGLQHLHVFESRDQAFKDDEVLQENLILHAVKSRKPNELVISKSPGPEFEDMTIFKVSADQIVDMKDPDLVIHIITSRLDQYVIDRMQVFQQTLNGLGIEVSTGPVVDFRLNEHIVERPNTHSIPLIYPAHFEKHHVRWPNENGRKPNALVDNEEIQKWLFPNGNYTLVRRFSAKEERRRIVAALHNPEIVPAEKIGFENHLNVFHAAHQGLDSDIAKGLAVYLNSTLVDIYFRQFNGHTQVNASDLRMLPYPDNQFLKSLSSYVPEHNFPTQDEIDTELERRILNTAKIVSPDPVKIKKRIDEAIEILQELGMPKAQQNERSALTLLAITSIKPPIPWKEAQASLIGITPIMDFIKEHYGKEYAPNTRETFRRFTMHQFVEAGIAVQNPDKPDRPVNSPNWCYQIEPAALALIKTYGSPKWKKALVTYLKNRETLAQRYAKERQMLLVSVTISKDEKIQLTPGKHSELIKRIIEDFCPRFVPGGQIIYVGDTGSKWGYFNKAKLEELGTKVDSHGKMPDAVIYDLKMNWLFLVEAVTSHGPVDSKRRIELEKLFKNSKADLVYITAFSTRSEMARYLPEISWETEVWVGEAPSHLIHFDGTRFLGPYERQTKTVT
jgi:adenine-specific DNA-methyltransferase